MLIHDEEQGMEPASKRRKFSVVSDDSGGPDFSDLWVSFDNLILTAEDRNIDAEGKEFILTLLSC